MKSKVRMASFWFVLCTVCLFPTQGLWAQSSNSSPLGSRGNSHLGPTEAGTGCGYSKEQVPLAPLMPKGSHQSNGTTRQPSLVLISGHDNRDSDNDSGSAAIVGLWKFAFTATSPFVGPFDAGYVTWHSDGTELMNSGRAPTTGDFCMGVWKQVGRSTYKLNHFALAWTFDASNPGTGPGTGGADFVGPANIREEVTVDHSGDSYEGTFTLVQYEPDGVTVITTITGTVTATRITAD
jgi:hypothetical protein